MHKQASSEDSVQVSLEKFLSWLLDARWFPETDRDYKRRIHAERRRFLALVRRLEVYAKDHPHFLISRALGDLREYAQSFPELLKPHIRTSPIGQVTSNQKGAPEVANRLLCARLVLTMLGYPGSIYAEMQRLLANPGSLPYPGLGPTTDVRGRLLKPRALHKDIKSLQSVVARLEREIKAGESSRMPVSVLVKNLYREYLWSTQSRVNISESEAGMLTGLLKLLPPTLSGSAQSITTAPDTISVNIERKLLFGSIEVEAEQMSRGYFQVPADCSGGKVTGVFSASGEKESEIKVILVDQTNRVLFDSGTVANGTIEVGGLRSGCYALAFLNLSTTSRKVVRGEIALVLTRP